MDYQILECSQFSSLLHLADFQLNERIYVSYTPSGQAVADGKMVELRQKSGKEFKEFHIALGDFCCLERARTFKSNIVLH